jgi:hypothetical protein
MKEDTPEQLEVIRQRQRGCTHSIVRGACDKEPRCVHCGISRAEYEAMGSAGGVNPYSGNVWSGSMGGVP